MGDSNDLDTEVPRMAATGQGTCDEKAFEAEKCLSWVNNEQENQGTQMTGMLSPTAEERAETWKANWGQCSSKFWLILHVIPYTSFPYALDQESANIRQRPHGESSGFWRPRGFCF